MDNEGLTVTYWCSGCNAEPAIVEIEVELNGEWTDLKIGQQCLTRAVESGMIE